MPYKSFEDLDVWKHASRLAQLTFTLRCKNARDYGLRDPLSGIDSLQHSRRRRARFHTRIQALSTHRQRFLSRAKNPTPHNQQDRNTRERSSGRTSTRDKSHISVVPSPCKLVKSLKPPLAIRLHCMLISCITHAFSLKKWGFPWQIYRFATCRKISIRPCKFGRKKKNLASPRSCWHSSDGNWS